MKLVYWRWLGCLDTITTNSKLEVLLAGEVADWLFGWPAGSHKIMMTMISGARAARRYTARRYTAAGELTDSAVLLEKQAGSYVVSSWLGTCLVLGG